MPNCKHGMDARFCAACANPSRSRESRRRLLMERAASHEPATAAEKEAYEAVYAYEEANTQINGKTTRANRTWPLIREKGVIAAVEGIVTRKEGTPAYRILVEMGLEDMTFEAVVLRHKESFSAEAISACEHRLTETREGTGVARLPRLPQKRRG